jgi:purine-binding chemotaxis protein CheW
VYCCDVEAVHEVVSLGVITRLPGAPAYVPGIINVRGVIITVVDAGLYLHGRPSETPGSVMLVHAGVRPVGLLVDAVSDVRTVRAEEGYHTLDVRAAVARVIVITEDE